MGLLGFLGKGGGSGLITGLAGTIAGSISSAKDRDLQRELQQKQMEYGREMYAMQSNDPDFNDFNNLPPDESDRGFDEMAKEGKLL